MVDKYTKQFIGMRYWLFGRNHYNNRKAFVLPALKMARRRFPRQEPADENIQYALLSQIELLRAAHKAQETLDR